MLRHFRYWVVRLARPALAVVTFRGGHAELVRGRAPAGWLGDCTAIGAEFGIVDGHVETVLMPFGLGLRFSPGIPVTCHQRFRNVFGSYPGR